MGSKLFNGTRAIVTGGASGIGKATAALFAAQGAHVVLFDIDAKGGEAAAAEIRTGGGQAFFVHGDMTDDNSVVTAVTAAEEQLGGLDVVVNAAGGSGRRWGDGPVTECSESGWDLTLALNLKSVFLCCKHAIPVLLKGQGGAIVNVASVLGLVGGGADFATHAYAASKGGIISLTRSIATYYAPQGLRANVICPGLISTPMSARAQASDRIRSRLADIQPLTGEFGQPEDVANAALYLASPLSSFVTGTVLPVDGGWTAY